MMIFIAKYVAVMHAMFYMLERRNVRGCFLGHLQKSVRVVLNIKILVPTETPGIATTVQSRGLLMNGLSQRPLCIRIAFFWKTCARRLDPRNRGTTGNSDRPYQLLTSDLDRKTIMGTYIGQR